MRIWSWQKRFYICGVLQMQGIFCLFFKNRIYRTSDKLEKCSVDWYEYLLSLNQWIARKSIKHFVKTYRFVLRTPIATRSTKCYMPEGPDILCLSKHKRASSFPKFIRFWVRIWCKSCALYNQAKAYPGARSRGRSRRLLRGGSL